MPEQTVPAAEPVAPMTPQAPATPTQGSTIHSSKTVYKQLPPSKYSPSYRAGFVRLGPSAPPPVPPPDKYSSIHSLEESKKVDALKDTKLNPDMIQDGYDALAHGLHLWTVVGNKAKNDPNIDFNSQQRIAGNFYDAIIAPAYARSGVNAMSKDLWLKQSYEDALGYKIEDAYSDNWVHSLKHGWNSGLAAT